MEEALDGEGQGTAPSNLTAPLGVRLTAPVFSASCMGTLLRPWASPGISVEPMMARGAKVTSEGSTVLANKYATVDEDASLSPENPLSSGLRLWTNGSLRSDVS